MNATFSMDSIFTPPPTAPNLFYNDSSTWGEFIRKEMPVLQEVFTPTCWATSSYAQTVIPPLFRGRQELLRNSRQVLHLPDGGACSLDWFEDADMSEDQLFSEPEKTPGIVMIFPGLVGDSQSDYLRWIVPELKKMGYRVVIFNQRGRSGVELRSPKLYNGADTSDYEFVIKKVRGDNPTCKITALAYSMGGMLLTRYLAEKGERDEYCLLDAAMIVSGTYDWSKGIKIMETGWVNRLVMRFMTKTLASIILKSKEVLEKAEKSVRWEKLLDATTLRELDEYFTCPMWGYENPEEYYKDCSNTDRMKHIKIPILCLNSADDMFNPQNCLPLTNLSDTSVFAVTKRGGHMGFMDGCPTIPYYGDRVIFDFFKLLASEPHISSLTPSSTRSQMIIDENQNQS